MISLECAVDSEWNGVINFVSSISVVELFVHKSCKNLSLQLSISTPKYLGTMYATAKPSVPFCLAQGGESTDMNCLVFWAHCENGKIWMKHQVYNKGILPILDNS